MAQFSFDDAALASLADFLDPETLDYLRDYRFSGDIDGYPEGELYFPGSPVLSVHGTFAECVVLETLALSIFNHDTAIASAAARMVSAAEGRPLIEMGSRRTHEQAAVAAARAAYIAGFAGILEPGGAAPLRRARAGHQRARLHAAAHHRATGPGRAGGVPRPGRRARRRHHAAGRHLRHHRRGGQRHRGRRAPNWARCASTPVIWAYWPGRCAHSSTSSAPPNTRIVVSGDLDEYAIAALRAEPVDTYGVGTSVVTGSGAPTAGMVYKLVEVDGMPVAEAQQPQGVPRRPQAGAAAVASRPARSSRRSSIPSGQPPNVG